MKFRAHHTGNRGRRHKPGEMNRTEAKFADELHISRAVGTIRDWWFEDMTFVLADRCRYTPDFAVLHNDGSLELIEVKGGQGASDDALVKIKCAAEKFYMYQWTMLKQLPKKAGGGWERRGF